MTLFKQMALAVSFLIIAILSAVLIQNYQTAKKDMVESLYQMTVNNISSLSATLAQNANKSAIMKSIISAKANGETSPQGKTPAIVKSTIDAAFDSGYYKLIEFKTDTYTYRQVDNEPIEGVPTWFIRLSDIKVAPITAEVSSDWSILGQLTILGDVALTYKALYKIFVNLIYLFIVFSIIALILLAILLHFILKPLKKVKYQAEAILNNEFIIQEEKPYTTEFRDVSSAMNSMVRRVKEIFKEATEAAKRNKELQYNDPVTKLFNRRYLMIKLPELISLEGRTNGGSIVLLALNEAQHLNQILGRQKTDEFFLQLAKIFKSICAMHDENLISRVNGTEFILVLPNAHTSETQHITQQINRDFDELLQKYKISQTQVNISIGIYRYRSQITVADLLTRVDTALLKAKNDERNNTYIYEEEYEEAPLSKTQWRSLLEDSIKNNNFNLEFFAVKETQTKKLIHKNMSFNILTQDNKAYCYNGFIAPAITLGMTSELYLGVLENLFVNYKSQLNAINYSLKLPKEFLEDENSFDKLSMLFNKYAKKMHFHLCFEVADSFAIHKTATVLGYGDLFKKYGFSIGINSYTSESNDFAYLKEINPKFIKVDTQFLLDQSEDAINTLRVITNSLDIFIVATSVQTQNDIKMLAKYKIYKAQGSIIETI